MKDLTIANQNPDADSLGNVTVLGINFKTVQNIYAGTRSNARWLILTASVVSNLVANLSAAASVKLLEVDQTVPICATLSTTLDGANNDLVFTAVTAGASGNSTTVRLLDPEANDATLSVTVAGAAITVHLATNGSGTITSTAALVKAAIDAKAEAAALVTVANKAANDGTGVVTALAATALTGGLDYTEIQTLVEQTTLDGGDATGVVQELMVVGGIFTGGNSLLLAVTGGSTATTDTKDFVLTFKSLP